MRGVLAHFLEQAGFCDALGSPFTARLLRALAADLEAGGVVADLVGSWAGRPRADAVSLRLAGALHAAVLSNRAPKLAEVYPAASPDGDPRAVAAAALAFLRREPAWAREFLSRAPQTNEPRRTIALLLGFLHVASRFDEPLQLFEIGASAGLNLYWDRFSYRTSTWGWGHPDARPVIDTEWHGTPPPTSVDLRVSGRAGCDLNPLRIDDPAERLRLRSFVWADQVERLSRFDAALERATAEGVVVEQADAAAWLEERLPNRPRGHLAVVYHSVFLQYPPPATRERIERAIVTAGEDDRGPVAWVRMEPETMVGGPARSKRFVVDVVTWPDGERRLLAETDGHARFVRAL